MTGAVYGRTPNMGLGLLEFNFPNWGDDANENTKIIDAGFSVLGIAVKGAWANNTPYILGDLVVDAELNSLWRCNFAHTSAATGTFADDRVLHPSYWTDASSALHARGQYTTATTYYTNDVTYKDANKTTWAVASRQFLSTNWDADIAASNLVVIVDMTAFVAKAGDTMTGALKLPVPVDGNVAQAVRKDYVDAADGNLTTALSLKAPILSPAFTGVPTGPTAGPGNNSTVLATTAFVQGEIATSDSGQAAALALKANIASPTFTGDPKAPTPTAGDNDTSIATTGFVTGAIATSDAAQGTALALKANIASPTFTGNPAAPTPTAGDNDTSIATTEFVTAAIAAAGSAPIGDVAFVYSLNAPTNYLKLNGALLNRVTYAALWAYAQTAAIYSTDAAWTTNGGAGFSPGDGSTTFRLPDMRGVFARAHDDGKGIDTGRLFVLQADAYLNHDHTGVAMGNHGHTAVAVPDHYHYTTTGTAYSSGASTILNTGTSPGSSQSMSSGKITFADGGHTPVINAASAGTPNINVSTTGGTETRPKNHPLLACIRYQ